MVEKKNAKATTPMALPVIRPRVAGIDIGSAQHWVCGPARADAHECRLVVAHELHAIGSIAKRHHALANAVRIGFGN